jgi:tryptophan-rich sensory protein
VTDRVTPLSRFAALLLVPCPAWVPFAGFLNFAIVRRNRRARIPPGYRLKTW